MSSTLIVLGRLRFCQCDHRDLISNDKLLLRRFLSPVVAGTKPQRIPAVHLNPTYIQDTAALRWLITPQLVSCVLVKLLQPLFFDIRYSQWESLHRDARYLKFFAEPAEIA